MILLVVLLAAGALHGAPANKSDLNGDGIVDLQDLQIFSITFAGQSWQTIDWCQWILDHGEYERRYGELFAFIRSYFNCISEPPPPPPENLLELVNAPVYPTRIAWDGSGNLYVTDAKVGSVFIYEPNVHLVGELKGLDKPLGILVDDVGRIYVGNNGRNNVEIYSPQGEKLETWGAGILSMPNSLSRDRDGNLYVADSENNRVSVFDGFGNLVRHIGESELNFPAAVSVHYRVDAAAGLEVGEVYVADQNNYLVRVYDLEGLLLRSFGGQGTVGGMMGTTYKWQGKFGRVSGLAFTPDGNLHAVDSFFCNVQVLNPVTGAYITYYGARGTDLGYLRVPLDVAINGQSLAAVADTYNARIQVYIR